MKKKSVILLSGGVDSTTLLYFKKEHIKKALFVLYGSRHNKRELICAKHHCKLLNIPLIVFRIPLNEIVLNSCLTNQRKKVPYGHYESNTMKSTVVPFRNGIMLSIAVSMAEDLKCNWVLIANHSGDHAIYPDCRKEFISYFNKASKRGTYNKVQVLSPFNMMSKTDIVRIGLRLRVDYSNTWSCYEGGSKPCGKCGTCNERIEAFLKNKINLK